MTNNTRNIVEEKPQSATAYPTDFVEEPLHIEEGAPEWTAEEEKALVRRVDLAVMPLLLAGFFVLQLDRQNIGNALTDFFFDEVGITQFQFNIGKQLMYLGIVLLEIPSNIILYRVGPALWIGFQILAWGMVATFQAFQKGLAAHLTTRFLLGCCEAGFIPAGLYTITRFYTRDETSKRFAWFYVGSMVANAVTGLIAYGILHMRGIGGLGGWQWLFLLEGLLTVVVAFAFITFFPKSTANPTSIFGLRYFNEREAQILTRRVILDDPTKEHPKLHISKEELKASLLNWRNIPHVVMTLCTLASTTSMFSYAPSIVASYGYGRLASNAMVSIGHWILMFNTLLWGTLADKWGRRGPLVLIGVAIGWIFIVANRFVIQGDDQKLKFAMITLIIGSSYIWHPVNGSWMALNAKTAGERSVTMALFAMSANASGIIGGQIFQAHDSPQYTTAWTVILSLATLGLAMASIANLQYWLLNRKHAKQGDSGWVYRY